MRTHRAGSILLPALFLAAVVTSAQNFGNPWDTPIIQKYWNPVVGAGVVYEVMNGRGKKSTEEFDILSELKLEGKTAYWLEFTQEMPDIKGKIYVKTLLVPEDLQARELIIQLPGLAAMEMPIDPTTQPAKSDPKNMPKLVGTESTTVPAGTFECEHWRYPDNSDAWVSAKVAPLKVVKSVSKLETRVLVRMTSHAKDAITGQVKPYDPGAIKKFSETQSKSK